MERLEEDCLCNDFSDRSTQVLKRSTLNHQRTRLQKTNMYVCMIPTLICIKDKSTKYTVSEQTFEVR